MPFVDRCIAPALRPLELDDTIVAIANADLVYAVLLAVERQQPAVNVESQSGDSIQDVVRFQGLERERRFGWLCHVDACVMAGGL